MAIDREVRYRFTETGADQVEAALEGVDRAADSAAAAGDRAGGSFKGLSQSMQDGLAPIDDHLRGFDALQGRLGQIANAVNLLSGVAIFNMVKGFVDAAGAMRDWIVDAEGAKKAAEELKAAQAELQKSVDEMASAYADLGAAAGVAQFFLDPENAKALAKATDETAKAAERRNKATERQAQIARETAALTAESEQVAARLKATAGSPTAATVLAQETKNLERLGKEMVKLGKEADSLDFEITAARVAEGLWVAQGEITKGTARERFQAFLDIAKGGHEAANGMRAAALSLEELNDLLAFSEDQGLSFNQVFGIDGPINELLAVPGQFAEAWRTALGEIQPAMESFGLSVAELTAQQAAVGAVADQTSAFFRAQAKSAAAAALAGVLAAKSAKEVVNALAKSIFQRASLEALFEAAKAVASSAPTAGVPNPVSAKHTEAALLFAAVAATAGVVAAGTGGLVGGGGGGGGAGGSGAPSAADLAPAPEPVEPTETIINVNFNGAALHTVTEIQDTVALALDEASRRRGRVRFNADRFRG